MFKIVSIRPDGKRREVDARSYQDAQAYVNGLTDQWQSDMIAVIVIRKGKIDTELTLTAAKRLKERFTYEAIQEQRYTCGDGSIDGSTYSRTMGASPSPASPIAGMRGPSVQDNI